LNKVRMITLFFLCALMTQACGYRFAGSGALPDNIKSIFIEVFKNHTSKAGVERVVTNQLIFEFTRQREKILTNDANNADATLKGDIKKIRSRTISRIGTEVANQREVIMTIDLKLINKSGDVIWSANALSDSQAYDVSDDSKLENDRAESIAISRLSERMSERIFNRLTDDF
jgi:outer membrane lipopolysaccharide assembly protein LptE/RlpB